MLGLWKALRKRLVSKDRLEEVAHSDLISSADPFEPVMGYCLQRLNTCSAGTAMYLLDCLCPADFDVVLELIRLDLGCPHQHNWFSKNVPLKPDSYEDLLAILRTLTSTIPEKEYSHF